MEGTGGTSAGKRFALIVAAITVAGLIIRVAWTLTHDMQSNAFLEDQTFYHRVANFVAGGLGYIEPHAYDHGFHEAAIRKPPLFPLVLAVETKLGFGSIMAHRLLSAALGAATIVPLAMLARKIGGYRIGILAALLAALYPPLWALDSQILSETLYGVLLCVALLLAYRLDERPSLGRGIALGAVLGLAALTRPEAIVVGALVGILIAYRHRRPSLVPLAAAAVAFMVVLAPWLARNWKDFGRPIMSTQSSANVAGANCPATYYGRDTGNWRFDCVPPARPREGQAAWTKRLEHRGVTYARDHAGRVPVVLLARVARTWGFFQPRSYVGGARRRSSWMEPVAAWILLVAAGLGAVVARRRRAPIAILLLLPLTVTITAIVQFGLLRYRFSADLALLILAAFALDALISRRAADEPAPPVPSPPREVPAPV